MTRNRKRTIVVKFLNFKGKSRILHTYREKKLWRENVLVNEDFLEETANICKGLLQKAKDLRSQNKVAKVVHDRLIVYEKREEMIFLRHKAILKLPKLKLKGYGYLITNVNKRMRFKYNTKFIQNESI